MKLILSKVLLLLFTVAILAHLLTFSSCELVTVKVDSECGPTAEVLFDPVTIEGANQLVACDVIQTYSKS